MRVVLIARGNKMVACLLSAVEITIWLIVTSTVLLGITEDPLRAVAYGVAFVIGIYLGILIEEKLALGLAQIEVIAVHDAARQITNELRGRGYGATTFECEGMEGRKMSIVLKVQRKDIPATLDLLKEHVIDHDVQFVTITDIRKISIGNVKRRVLRGEVLH